MFQELGKILYDNNLSLVSQTGDIISISGLNRDSKIATAKVLVSEEIDYEVDGSMNGIEIDGIGILDLTFILNETKTDIVIFAYIRVKTNNTEFLVLPFDFFVERISAQRFNGEIIFFKYYRNKIKFWLLPNNDVIDATGLGAEGEWIFVPGRFYVDGDQDYSQFRNGWQIINSFL